MATSTRLLPERATTQKAPSLVSRDILSAFKNRDLRKGEINRLKAEGIIGENNRGLVEVVDTERLDRDPALKQKVLRLVEEENRDRRAIMERVIQRNARLRSRDREKVYAVFARINQRKSAPGTWIQLSNGKWVRK